MYSLRHCNSFSQKEGYDVDIALSMEETEALTRLSKSIDNILLLQNNLKSFLHDSPSQNDKLDIVALAHNRLKFMQNMYPKITFRHSHSLLVQATHLLMIQMLPNLYKISMPTMWEVDTFLRKNFMQISRIAMLKVNLLAIIPQSPS